MTKIDSPTPSLPEDAARVVEVLNDTLRFDRVSGPTRLTAAALIQSLSSQLAEARAELKMLHTHNLAGRDAIEADRDRLAAELELAKPVYSRRKLERKVAVAKEALEIIAGKRQCLDNLMGNADVAEAALASLEDR